MDSFDGIPMWMIAPWRLRDRDLEIVRRHRESAVDGQQTNDLCRSKHVLRVALRSTENALRRAREFRDRLTPAGLIPLDMPTMLLPLGTQARRCLLNNHLTTVERILEWSDCDLSRIPNFGKHSLRELRSLLERVVPPPPEVVEAERRAAAAAEREAARRRFATHYDRSLVPTRLMKAEERVDNERHDPHKPPVYAMRHLEPSAREVLRQIARASGLVAPKLDPGNGHTSTEPVHCAQLVGHDEGWKLVVDQDPLFIAHFDDRDIAVLERKGFLNHIRKGFCHREVFPPLCLSERGRRFIVEGEVATTVSGAPLFAYLEDAPEDARHAAGAAEPLPPPKPPIHLAFASPGTPKRPEILGVVISGDPADPAGTVDFWSPKMSYHGQYRGGMVYKPFYDLDECRQKVVAAPAAIVWHGRIEADDPDELLARIRRYLEDPAIEPALGAQSSQQDLASTQDNRAGAP